jgi:serine/threonine-protein kinase/endoribonuclease IRE1
MPTDGIVLYQIANGVNYIHSRNLVHRDIKPDDILNSITQSLQMKEDDFKLVKVITDEGCYFLSEIRVTPLYGAPQLLEKSESTTDSIYLVKADLFSTDGMFFFFLTRGFHPFHDKKKVDSENWAQVKEKIMKNEPIGLESTDRKYFL